MIKIGWLLCLLNLPSLLSAGVAIPNVAIQDVSTANHTSVDRDINCNPPTKTTPPLDYNDCRIAIARFDSAFPGARSSLRKDRYFLSHTDEHPAGAKWLKCPVTSMHGTCGFTVDFKAFEEGERVLQNLVNFEIDGLDSAQECEGRQKYFGAKSMHYNVDFILYTYLTPVMKPGEGNITMNTVAIS